ncbi:MAG: hypothetical protein J6T01_04180 [Kiritimatiellae bacterium]|nr:hypothetical protein [Kiritimatiellia bacterium]
MKKIQISAACALAAAAACAQLAPFTVDFARETGKLKRLNGVCNATPLSNARLNSINDMVLKLEIPFYRLHDAALENPGLQLVDVRRIFPVFSADPAKAENYNFGPTDDYLKQIVDSGAKIEFRLGESIEHSPKVYLVKPPPDYEKWAEICCHIIRHYNEGWADGFKWDIRYWTIWEEPNCNPMLLTGAPNPFREIYLPLYKAASLHIKKQFPNIKIGGPQTGGVHLMKEFVEFCATNSLPLDYCAFTSYTRRPETYAEQVETVRKLLDGNGYGKTEIAIAEWHWGPLGWAWHSSGPSPRHAREWNRQLTGYDSSAFTAAVLIRMQDAPVDYMFYYGMKCGSWGLFDRYRQPYPSYYSMLAFAQLLHGDVRVAAATTPAENWYVLASKEKATGRGRVLMAALRTDREPKIILKGGVKPVSVKTVDPVHDLEETQGWVWHADREQLYIPRNVGDSAVWLIETEPAAAGK